MTKLIAKDHSITNLAIMNICKQYGIPLNACIMKDELTDLKLGNYIINLENHNQNGSHWIALVVGTHECVWMDSFGAPPTEMISYTLRQHYSRINYNNFIVQNINSNACGYFCIGLLLYLKKHSKQYKTLTGKVNDYVNLFEDDTTKNNKILFDYLKKNTK